MLAANGTCGTSGYAVKGALRAPSALNAPFMASRMSRTRLSRRGTTGFTHKRTSTEPGGQAGRTDSEIHGSHIRPQQTPPATRFCRWSPVAAGTDSAGRRGDGCPHAPMSATSGPQNRTPTLLGRASSCPQAAVATAASGPPESSLAAGTDSRGRCGVGCPHNWDGCPQTRRSHRFLSVVCRSVESGGRRPTRVSQPSFRR